MRTNSTKAPSAIDEDPIDDQYIAIHDRTADKVKVVICNQENPNEWIEADPDDSVAWKEKR